MEKISLGFRDQLVQSVLKKGDSKFVQLSMEPGQGLTKHRAPLGLTVVVLTGRVSFTVGEDTKVLDASEMVTLEPSVEHAIEAVDRSTVLLVLTPEARPAAEPNSADNKPLQHENAFQHPELMEQIAPELRPLVEDHIELCGWIQATKEAPDQAHVRALLKAIQKELFRHFVAEEEVLFPRMAAHLGGLDVGPVVRLLEEHKHIRSLHAEARSLLTASEQAGDEHIGSLLSNKISELSRALLNHLGKEDSHLFPMASRLLTAEEKSAITTGLKRYL